MMATSTSVTQEVIACDVTTSAQEVIKCDLCYKSVNQFCINCQINLCLDCVNKHVNKFQSLSHDIVHCKNRKLQMVIPECKSHPTMRCEAFCKKCETPACTKCLIGQHKLHDTEEIASFVESKKQKIKMETEEIEFQLIKKYQVKVAGIQSKICLATSEFDILEQDNKRLRTLWHKEVDAIFDKFESVIHSTKDNDLGSLRENQMKITNMISDMIKTVEENKQILKTNRVSEVTSHCSKLLKYRKVLSESTIKIPSLDTKKFNSAGLSIELGGIKASLSQTSLSNSYVSFSSSSGLLKTARVDATLSTEHKPLLNVYCIGTDQAWTSGETSTVSRVDIYGYSQDTVVTSCRFWPSDIVVSNEGDMMYSNNYGRAVDVVRQGKVETLLTTPEGWRPNSLCCTGSGDVLVNISRDGRNKIVRYKGQQIIQEIYKDEHGNPIFENGSFNLFLRENNNRDICVVDLNKGIVIVLDKRGRVRFQYDGTSAMKERKFAPRCLVTDSLSNIIVTDIGNECLHILNQDRQFLRCISNCGLAKPYGVSLDKNGRLWVGLRHTGQVKVIRYLQ